MGSNTIPVFFEEKPVFVQTEKYFENRIAQFNIKKFVVSGDFVYFIDASDNDFKILNMKQENNGPGEVVGTFSGISDVIGNKAYTWHTSDGIAAYEISNFLSPIFLGSFDPPGKVTFDLSVEGNYAYLCNYNSDDGMTIVDISISGSMKEVANIIDTQGSIGFIYQVEVHGDFAYLCDHK